MSNKDVCTRFNMLTSQQKADDASISFNPSDFSHISHETLKEHNSILWSNLSFLYIQRLWMQRGLKPIHIEIWWWCDHSLKKKSSGVWLLWHLCNQHANDCLVTFLFACYSICLWLIIDVQKSTQPLEIWNVIVKFSWVITTISQNFFITTPRFACRHFKTG